jgi:hypothetical protein
MSLSPCKLWFSSMPPDKSQVHLDATREWNSSNGVSISMNYESPKDLAHHKYMQLMQQLNQRDVMVGVCMQGQTICRREASSIFLHLLSNSFKMLLNFNS